VIRVGDLAPGFVAKSTAGDTIDLAAMRGKRLVLYFFPKAFTPG
jgi:peroxiredoxin Q/BCP